MIEDIIGYCSTILHVDTEHLPMSIQYNYFNEYIIHFDLKSQISQDLYHENSLGKTIYSN